MKKGKKILSILVIVITILGLSMAIPINAGDNDPINPIENNIQNEDSETEFIYVDGQYYVCKPFPPLTEEDLLTSIPDPQPTMPFEQLPSQFSWLNYGGDWTTIAKDQQSCGSCWAFGALGGLDAAINIASGFPDFDVDLSEQYILSCLGAAGSCGGGWMHEAIDYIYSTNPGSTGNNINGVPLESCMPYQAVDWIPCDQKCEDWDYYTVPPQPDNTLWQIEDWGWTSSFQEDNPNDWETIKTWVYTYGPIVVDIYTGGWSSYWSSHHSPDDVYQQDDNGITNHAQVLCGWVDDNNILNGGYWILKNSWGTGWGYNGFSNIAYGCNGVATRDTTWVTAIEWPKEIKGPGPGRPEMHVFADFEYGPEYPKLGDEIEFSDTSMGNVVLWEWDFNGDGVIDSNQKKPKYQYFVEDDYEVTLTVWSSAGLNSTKTSIVEVKEIWPPFAETNPEYYSGDDPVVYFDGRLSYDVDGEIVSYHWDFGDGKTSDLPFVTHEFSNADKIYNVTLTVTDNEGAKDSSNCDIRIDQTVPPETEVSFDVGADDTQWFKNPQDVTLIAKDWTGLYRTYYRVDGGEYNVVSCYGEKNYDITFRIRDMGIHNLEFYSVDVYGNEESLRTEKVRIDMEPPSLDIGMSGGTMEDGWYVNPVTVSLDGSDDLSGLDKIVYKVNYGAWQDYSSSFSLKDGQNRLWAYSIDKAGNSYGDDDPIMVKIDSGPPKTQAIIDGVGSGNTYYKTVTFSLVANDPGVGVEAIYFNVNGGGGFELYSSPLEIDEVGSHTIDFYAVDKLGNKEASQSIDIVISPFNFDMEIAKPTNGLYLFGFKLLGLSDTIIIGNIDIDVSLTPFTGGAADVEYVEFFLDGVLKITDSSPPYIWRLDEQMFGSHEIKVTAYNDGESISETREITAFIL